MNDFLDKFDLDDIECPLCGGCLIERDHAMSKCPGPSKTSERVAPAAVKGSDVEQQTEEVGTQLQEEKPRES